MIDSHAHLIFQNFDVDRKEMIERAINSGVKAFVHPCVLLSEWPQIKDLKDQYPGKIFLAAGVHPCYTHSWQTEISSAQIASLSGEIVAIGETGLDFHQKELSFEVQEEAFRSQCRLAKEFDLPLIVHCRDAFAETLEILREENAGKGVMHCYTGDADYSARFWELGFYTSFSGCLTFKNARSLRQAAKNIPLERTLIETDAPFLAPQKNRGKRNEPSFMTEVCEMLAQIHDKSLAEVEQITENNTIKLFKLDIS